MRTITNGLAALFVSASPAMAMDDPATYWRVDGLVERRASSVSPDTAWQGSAWIGGDTDKIRLESSGVLGDDGHIENEGGTQGIDNRLFYSRLISPFWDAKVGLQMSVFDGGQTRAGFVAGFEGLAPYDIHLDVTAGITQTGVVSGRLEARYDLLLSQRLIAQPFVEVAAAASDDRAIGLGAGLSRLEGGLRLRYEIEKEFAPFIGVGFEQFTGNTAGFAASDGEQTSKLRVLAGLKVWF
jgi:copper resistance protein B